MALKDKWVDKVDGQDYVQAEDINNVAHAIIALEENGVGSSLPEVTAADNGKFLRVVDGVWVPFMLTDASTEEIPPRAFAAYTGEYEEVK